MQVTEKLTVTSDAPGLSIFMLGNEAIARGALEAGIQVMAAYPGTPSSEISETLIHASKEMGFYGEWSVNEKVAFEVAFGASTTGVRALTACKHVGLNVAHDTLMSATYMGARGGMVLVDADDPGLWSSQNEQDNRFIAEQAYLPVLEPASPQEAKDMMVEAFDLSEKYGQIFMLRTVTRLSHARGDVKLGPLPKEKRKGLFEKGSQRFVCMPAFARRNRAIMIEKFARIKADVDKSPYNQLRPAPSAKYGIIASGISYSYAIEALSWLGLEDKVSVLKIGTPHPLPEKLVALLLSSVPEVLVIEELEPFVENHVKVIAQENNIQVKIHGKDMVPVKLELSTRIVTESIMKLTGVRPPVDFSSIDSTIKETNPMLPERPPTMCAGCPHRASFHAINVAARKLRKDLGERVLTGDIGCYSLGVYPPLNAYDTALCMGGGFGIANGIAKVHPGPVIGHVGDSTFFHSGIPALLDAVFNKTKAVFIILDNSATSMTGFQPHPGAPGAGQEPVKIEEVARACGVKFVEVVNCFDLKKTAEVVERAARFDGPAVVVSRGMCAILAQRERRQRGEKTALYTVDLNECTDCRLCVNSLGCPAIVIEDNHVAIDSSQCDGCGLCAQVCPSGAIKKVEK